MIKLPIYLDNHSTTPLDPRALDAMMPFFVSEFGNPAARNHAYGWRAEAAVEKARCQVARLIGAHPQEIIFTSGATESNNIAIKGILAGSQNKHLVVSAIEHRSVLEACRAMEKNGASITYVKPDSDGIVPISHVQASMKSETVLVCAMLVNNEIGTINPVQDIAAFAHDCRALFHCDLTQAVGRIPVNVRDLQIDLAALSAHKIYGPKGIGALFVRRELQERIDPLLHGGGQERGVRSGTLNVPAIVGFGAACDLLVDEMQSETQRILHLREMLRSTLIDALPNVKTNGSLSHRIAGNLNISFESIDGEDLLLALGPIMAVSQGAACSSKPFLASHVLKCLGLSNALAGATLRFGIGRFNTKAEIEYAAETIIREVSRFLV